MKNKDFIKKSIEENIVDHNTILNNLRAKAIQVDSENNFSEKNQKSHYGVGSRRAALIFTMFVLTSAVILCSTFLFKPDNTNTPPMLSDTSVAQICSNNDTNDISEAIEVSEESSEVNNSYSDDESRDLNGNDDSDDIITKTPLDTEATIFFADFANKFDIYQKIMNAELEYDNEFCQDGYAPVIDERFQSIKSLEDFLYSFMAPALAGEKFNIITEGVMIYREVNKILYVKVNIEEIMTTEILIQTAYLVSKDEDTLVISAMVTGAEQNYYKTFSFVSLNDGWLYTDDWNRINNFSETNQ
ncbi:MAG: hypothetical protein A2Y15_01070 [Clostridiales bacterium GWF2_36_10]|nr:MAG: hypothetical protein A2Y15_01070 [Clostridiales bacterium GWF2_36_10]HAN20549.1 hypothetical protein [Clostridiales bacterium]